MKDFDEARAARIIDPAERSFKLGGETFTVRGSVRPETLLPAIHLDKASGGDILAIHDQIISGFLDGDGPERYARLRQREDDPITIQDQVDVIEWIQELVTGHPTVPSSTSTGGPTPTGPSLTDVSLPPPAAEAG